MFTIQYEPKEHAAMLDRIMNEAVRPESDGLEAETRDLLTEALREGARKMLAAAIEAEVEEFH